MRFTTACPDFPADVVFQNRRNCQWRHIGCADGDVPCAARPTTRQGNPVLPRFATRKSIAGCSARSAPSSLIPVHKLATRDPMHDLQLLRDVAIINEQVRRELGPMPKSRGNNARTDSETGENNSMNLKIMPSVIALGALVAGGAVAGHVGALPSLIEDRGYAKFQRYASVQLGAGTECIVGASSDEDGLNQRPRVRLSRGNAELWSRYIDIPSEYYAGRATHCLQRGGSVYVLVQIDTQSQSSLSQTLLRIVRMKHADGAIEGWADLEVPGTTGAYSAWVTGGIGNFRSMGDSIALTGKYRYLNADDVQAFSMNVASGLK